MIFVHILEDMIISMPGRWEGGGPKWHLCNPVRSNRKQSPGRLSISDTLETRMPWITVACLEATAM